MWRITTCLAFASLASLTVSPSYGGYGDCTGIKLETNVDCTNIGPCRGGGTGSCLKAKIRLSDGTVEDGYLVWQNIMNVGKCQYESEFDNDGCADCDKIVCAEGYRYAARDDQNQCQVQMYYVTGSCSSCCVN